MLRHAESIGNKHGYDVSDPDRLTETGRDQVARVTETLADLSIDRVACSPLNRTRDTVRPYLRRNDEAAEVWAELREACWQEHVDETVESLRYGSDISLPADDQTHFDLRADEYPSCDPPPGETYAEGLARIRVAVSRVLDVLDSDDCDSLLLVGHGHTHLPRMCELLLGVEPDGPRRFDFDNVGLTKLVREPDFDSRFKIRYNNRLP